MFEDVKCHSLAYRDYMLFVFSHNASFNYEDENANILNRSLVMH